MTTITLHIRGLDPEGVRVAELVDAGFDDALITQERVGDRGVIELEVDRLNPTAFRALVRRAQRVDGVEVHGVGPSPLVNAAEIATRLGRTRQSVGQLATGVRGPGGWPLPVNPDARAPVWEWGAVARWANEHLDADIPVEEIHQAELLVWANTILRLGDARNVPRIGASVHEVAHAALHG